MEPSWNAWLSEAEMDYESSLIYQWEMASLNQGNQEVVPPDHQLETGLQQSLSSESCRSPSLHYLTSGEAPAQVEGNVNAERPRRSQLQAFLWNFGDSKNTMGLDPADQSSYITDPFQFCKHLSANDHLLGKQIMSEEALRILGSAGSEQNCGEIVRGESKNVEVQGQLSHAQEHIIAERKRREKLNQKFIELSAIIPGLQKVDKASVLGGAVRYVKELQATVKALEDQNMKRTVESAVTVKRSHVFSADDETSSSDGYLDREPTQSSFPEIEAKLSDNNILIRIHCEKKKGILVKTLTELEMLNLTITTTNVTPFLGSSIIITLTAQIEEEFSMTVEDLMKKLKSTLS